MNYTRLTNYIALPVLLVAAVLEIYWLWGLLFLWWAVPAIMTGQTALVFEISRETDPILFWAVTALWAVFGLMMIAASLFPAWSPLLV